MVPVILVLLMVLGSGGIAQGAISANTVWEVETVGSDSNGCGFVTGASGTDYSQSATAHATLTTASTVNTTTTIVNVAVGDYTVTANDVGNLYHNTGGTATAGFYQILSADTVNNRWTLDRAIGTAGQTLTGRMGGACLTQGTVAVNQVNGNVVWFKTGTYPYTAEITINGWQNIAWIGYGSVRGDDTQATFSTSTSSIETLHLTGTASSTLRFANLVLTNTAATPFTASYQQVSCFNCIFDHVTASGYAFFIWTASISTFQLNRLDVSGMTNTCFHIDAPIGSLSSFILTNSWVHACVSHGIDFANAGPIVSISNTVISGTGGNGINAGAASSTQSQITLMNDVFYANSANGVFVANGGFVDIGAYNTVFYGNTNYGISAASTTGTFLQNQSGYGGYNAYGSNGSGATLNYNTFPTDIVLTANPFTNPAAGDFSLNATAGGGVLLSGAGFPGTAPFGTGALSVGALTNAGTSSGGAHTFGAAY